MTIEEKRRTLYSYCGGVDCKVCLLNYGVGGEIKCLNFRNAAEAELDKALEITGNKKATLNENVDHPKHYQGKNECIDVMIAMFGVEAVKHFCMCNAYKYRFRAAAKNGAEDIAKAEWYESKLIELNKL